MENVHLLVLIHGMWGNPTHLAELRRIITEVKGSTDSEDPDSPQLIVLVAETNRDESTYDGIDWGGERVAQEVFEKTEKLKSEGKTVSRFSVAGYSLGGLVARYLIGILHQRQFFDEVTPVNFTTLATPHIGIPRFPNTFSFMISHLGPMLLSRSGEQFFCVDKWSPKGRPLVEVLADPERIFYQALMLFPHVRFYANAINDMTVPYVTAGIDIEDPFMNHKTNGIHIEFHENYKHLIKSYSLPDMPPQLPPPPPVLSGRWFRSFVPTRSFLPPVLQRKFPLNVAIYVAVPLLLPVLLSLILLRLSLASRQSRVRLKSLEADVSSGERLIHIIARIERELEGAVVDYMEDSDPTSAAAEHEMQLENAAISAASDDIVTTSHEPMNIEVTSSANGIVALPEVPQIEASTTNPPRSYSARLTPVQLRCLKHLNGLPNLKKERAFFEAVNNSHAVIVCRDVSRFEHHRQGEGVLRHWADNFVL